VTAAVAVAATPISTFAGALTATFPTTAVTVTAAAALRPSLVAVTEAVPAATAVTRPSADTVATVVAFEDQLITRPLSVAPAASRVVAVSWSDPGIVNVKAV